MLQDTVFVKNLAATAITGSDAWNRPTAQPILISVAIDTDFSKASETDNLKYSLNYAVISRNVSEYMKLHESKNFKSLQNIAEEVCKIVTDQKRGGGEQATVCVNSAKSEIRADSIEYQLTRNPSMKLDVLDTITVRRLRLLTIIGVFTFERLKRQIVDVDLKIELLPNHNVQIHIIMDEITNYVEGSNFKTVEALEMAIGQLIFQGNGDHIQKAVVTITKPNAITYTDGVGVESSITRERFVGAEPIKVDSSANVSESFNLPADKSVDGAGFHTAFIAFGSNEGNQVENITKSIELLDKYDVKVSATSAMYISKPMYYKDQPDFFNGVFKVEFSDKSPHDLLKILKNIEYNHINRVKEFDNGPRSIDLDILLYDDISINTPDLTVPHRAMLDRTFVLQPLCELIAPDYVHPVTAEPVHNHLQQLLKSSVHESIQESSKLLQYVPVNRLTPSENPFKFDLLTNHSPTLMMGILNITPDSFSDGGKNYGVELDQVLANAAQLVADGAKIIDIGGVSTRPGSEEPTEEEELRRVVPIVEAIRSSVNKNLANVLVSIDTYRSSVAEASLKAGADIINDISMGLYDDKMFEVVARYGCAYILNHTRGTAKTMSQLTNYEANTNEDIIELLVDPVTGQLDSVSDSPSVNNLINGIGREQASQISKAFKQGVRKWQVILDPGLGFAKNLTQNLAILKHSHSFKHYSTILRQQANTETGTANEKYMSFNGLPLLLGPSRKRFLGTINNEPTAETRVFSTAASIVVCVQQETNIVRVHDTKEIFKTIAVADAIYRDLY
ncbi:trifunctional dihydropteroate synthetase [Yamadazyma tenuis]|uniref:Folic acid synthesis protein fol1 n=1 Tax=Candida tenuis (strain ATCC 10573 / BCRC 21748 / CBS 615 / JCM 9827 / NBRC 10315 / NRRL Y-1498 / VKM Y-70) TaxID=590646 RepID=G3BAJ9_CANTC|nr:uncharacterized protein CANTEDRAFT_124080 [Yamadazyma tenuis ATCC 10573]EGV61421.1 hypothetical protein CANTEDRAFT_124080 [Yamadazyma tenuis ATCC 10573]WEJ92640.1 trifunctional dihydropteroate synthetase [Yamadazyma tenuis]